MAIEGCHCNNHPIPSSPREAKGKEFTLSTAVCYRGTISAEQCGFCQTLSLTLSNLM